MANVHSDYMQMDSASTETLWLKFKDDLTKAVNTFIPQKTARPKTSKPWMTPDIRKLVKRRDRVYKLWKKTGSVLLQNESVALRRTIQRLQRRSYWQYVDQSISTDHSESYQAHQKKFWTFIKKSELFGGWCFPTEGQRAAVSRP